MKQQLVLSNKNAQPSKPQVKHVFTTDIEKNISTDVDANAALMNAHKINMQQDIVVAHLEERIKMLEKEIIEYKEKAYCSCGATSIPCEKNFEYATDSDELAAETETEWITQKSRKNKKRKLNNTLTPPHTIGTKTKSVYKGPKTKPTSTIIDNRWCDRL